MPGQCFEKMLVPWRFEMAKLLCDFVVLINGFISSYLGAAISWWFRVVEPKLRMFRAMSFSPP